MDDPVVVIAAGNSRTKVAVMRGGAMERFPVVLETARVTAEALREVLGSFGVLPAARAVLCSVVPRVSAMADDALRLLKAEPALPVDAEKIDWMRMDYAPRAAIGADRVCCVLGLREQYGGPAVAVDFGTATTFNMIDAEGNFAGGNIAPGIATALASLHAATARLPLVKVPDPHRLPPLLARGTEESIAGGVFWSAWHAVRGMAEEAERRAGQPVRVVLTGGGAGLFAGVAGPRCIQDEFLLFKGVAAYAARVR
ncbi:MAG: type III pantothenate kinase [Ignavibacteria bacterium]|nr:type III pantothenate kinase [Ignavibacteria bacterium]